VNSALLRIAFHSNHLRDCKLEPEGLRNPMTSVRHYLVQGRVQGVGFRWFVHREAATIGGLRGWVRNTDDGHVEVVVAGEASQIALLKSALHRGSRGSRVDGVVEHQLVESEGENLGPFQIEGAW